MLPEPGPHGGDAVAVAAALGVEPEELLDLSQSLNPVAPDVARVIASRLGSIGRYPDPAAATSCLAEAIGVPEDELLLTNGGAEAIHLVAQVVGGRVEEPEFSLHPRGDDPDEPFWRSNPHCPTGHLAPADVHADVWDEAYYPLATGMWTRGDPDSIVVGSLTKLLGCPGLRIGYVMADGSTIEQCKAVQPMWSVGSLAVAALPDLLQAVDLPAWHHRVNRLRCELVALLEAHDLRAEQSDANWVLVEAPGLRDALAPRGVLVRDCSSFGMPKVFRIAVPGEEGLERLDIALSSARSELAG